MKLLIVDDDRDLCSFIERRLGDLSPSTRVTTAGCKESCLLALAMQQFNCALVDFCLPDCEGDEIIRLIAKHQPECAALVISGYSNQEPAIRSFRSGSKDFIHKDDVIDVEKLWDRITRVVEQTRREHRERRRMDRRMNELQEMASRDPLTGLYNRRRVEEFFKADRRRTLDRRRSIGVIMLDLDHFKRINDTYGHEAGDKVLVETAGIIHNGCQSQDVAARWGGEEFLIIKSNTTNAEVAAVAEELRNRIESTTVTLNETAIEVTASIGLCTRPADALSLEVIHNADKALYLAKQEGRNRVRSFERDVRAVGHESRRYALAERPTAAPVGRSG